MYTKQQWSDSISSYTELTQDKLNHIENGIYDNSSILESMKPKKVATLTFVGQDYNQENAGTGTCTADLLYIEHINICILKANSPGNISGGNKQASSFVCDATPYQQYLPLNNTTLHMYSGLSSYSSYEGFYKVQLVINVEQNKFVIQLQSFSNKSLVSGWTGNCTWIAGI